MMRLPLQNFSTLIQTMAAGVQGAATQLLDLTVGSVLRAVLEANAAIALWMQWLILQVLGTTRAATSVGADLDSWVADFSLVRLGPAASVGVITLSRITAGVAAFVPVGTQIRSADGSQSFNVSAAPSNPAFVAALNGYNFSAGLNSLSVPVLANVTGAAGNLQAGGASVLGSAVAGIDSVNNPAPFSGGVDGESDAALRARFANYIQSRSRATPLAVGYAVASVQPGLAYVITENVDSQGNMVAGSFLVTVDDGTGYPSASLLQSAATAVDAVRPVGSVFSVRAPQVLSATITMSIATNNLANHTATAASVTLALNAVIDTLAIGAALPWSRLAQIAYDASPLVTNVFNVVLNGLAADMVAPSFGVIKAGSVVVS